MQKMNIIIWGVNSTRPSMTEYLIKKHPDEVLFIISNNPASWGKHVLGKKVIGPSVLEEYSCDRVKVIIATYKHIEEIKAQALTYGHNAVSFVWDMKEEYSGYLLQNCSRDKNGYTPRHLHINFTEECNLSCIWCYFHGLAGREVNPNPPSSGGKAKHISDTVLKDIVNSVRDIHSVDTLCFATAGELFVNKRWFEQVSFVLKELPQIKTFILTTNGMLLHEKNIQKLIDLNVAKIQLHISIDGNSPQETEEYRVNSSYDTIRQNLMLLQSKIDCGGKFSVDIQSRHPLDVQKGERPDSPISPKYLAEDFPNFTCGTGIVIVPDLDKADCFADYGLKPTVFHRKDHSVRMLCRDPFESIYFDYLGNMRMCACGQFSEQIIIGKAGDHCLDVWQNNKILQEVRRQFEKFEPSPYCGHCTMQNLKQLHYLCRNGYEKEV